MNIRRILGIGGGMLLFAGIVMWLVTPRTDVPAPTPDDVDDASYRTMSSDVYNLSFEYRTAPDGYELREVPREEGEVTTFLHRYDLFDQAALAEFEESDMSREAPPAIRVSVYENPETVDASEWGSGMLQYADIDTRLTEPEETTVSDVPATQYRADGLYASDVVWVSAGDFMYRFQGEWMDEQSGIRDDFEQLLDSVTLFNL